MANEPTPEPTAGPSWQAKQVYAMAVISLVVGLAIGYLFRGSQSPAAPPPHTSRDFVPWRFLDAGRHSAWMGSSSRRPKTCTQSDVL